MFTEAVEIFMVKKKIKKKDLANILGCSMSNIYTKFRRGSFTESDLQKIADAYSCKADFRFLDNETGKPV